MQQALILMAHADDETLGAGGTIQKLVEKEWDVRVVVMSDGVVTAGETLRDNRQGAVDACHHLGIGEPIFMGFEDQKFDMVPMAELAGRVGSLQLTPDLIITHVHTDLNLDHRLTLDAAKIVGRPRKKPVTILGSEIPNTSIWNNTPFEANFYVDISKELKRKIEAFEKYEYEIQEFPHPWSVEGLELLAKYHGMQSGCEYAEAFHLYRGYGNISIH